MAGRRARRSSVDPATRVDGPERARGEAIYTADVRLNGMLHAAVLRSPHASARVTRIDPSPALALPGVHAALGPGEIPQLVRRLQLPGRGGRGGLRRHARAGARPLSRAIEVDWEVREPLLDPDEAVRRGSLVDEEPRLRERGDYERGLAEADVVVERRVPHRSPCCTARWRRTRPSSQWVGDGVEVHISTQYIWGIRDEVAAGLELPPDKVRVICHYMGGGFGSKNGADDYTFIAAELAKRTGRPVKCALTRREENIAAGNRNATIQRLTIGAKTDGTLTALGGDFVNAVGWAGWTAGTEGPMQMLYSCPNVKTTTYGAKINQPPMKAFRAPGFVEGTFGLEALLDELASKLDIDPLELRRKNYADTRPGRRPSVQQQEPDGVLPARRAALGAPPRGARPLDGDREARRRDGVADLVRRRRAAELRVDARRLRRSRDGRDGDAGHRHRTKTAMAQIAAEELGIPLEHVTVSLGDSARGPYAAISAGSSTTPSMGPAVRAAAADAKRQIIEIAAQRYDLEERTLDIRAATSSRDGRARRSRGRRAARGRTDPRQGRTRPEPGRHAGADVRRPGRRGRRRRRDRRGLGRPDRGDPRRRPRDQPARRVEPDRGRDHPGHRPHALGGAAARPADRPDPDDDASTRTSCRRSPTCRRSSAS